MNHSTQSAMTFALICLVTLSACGGGGSKNSVSPVSGTSTSSSSLVMGSSSTPATSTISVSSSSLSVGQTCQIDGKYWSLCNDDQGSWQYENGRYCVAQRFCPANRTGLPTAAGRTSPVNLKATDKTQAIYSYLRSIWGKQTLTGQQDLTWKDDIDMAARVYQATGKYPAIMGYDFMNYGMTAGWVEGLNQTEEAIAYANKGGLITFAWHWRDPSLLNTAKANEAHFYVPSANQKENTDFTIPVARGALDTTSPAYAQINAGIDLIAAELKKMADAEVPVLWRPLHEASGNNGNGWFWWGRARTDDVPQAFAQILLWRHMYDRLVNVHGLNNLLWVWNGQSAAWYPGDDVVDIISHDIYDSTDNQTYKSQVGIFTQARKYSDEAKLIALSENSFIPDPEKMAADGAWWLWFMTWNDGNFDSQTLESTTHKDNFWSGDFYNNSAHKTKVFNHENMITLDELPQFD